MNTMIDPSTAQTDLPENWMEKLKANDDKVLRILYTVNYPKIEKYLLDNNGTTADAEDIYQEAFLATWRNVQLDKVLFADIDKFQGYLFRVAQHKWLDHLRINKKFKTELRVVEDVQDEFINLEEEDSEYIERVKAEYALIGEPCRELLHRFYFLKQSMQEIAKIFTWTEATAKNNKYRCLQRLRNKIIPKKD